MSDDEQSPTHQLTVEAVRWGIDTLGKQRLHPTFVMYLYLRTQQRAGKLADASAKSEEVQALIRMPGNASKPYFFPLIDRGKRTGELLSSFWRAENISGSWSPGSIRRQSASAWLSATDSAYAWPEGHLQFALQQMLYGKRAPALAFGAFFLRNDGLVLSGQPGAPDVIAAFRDKFDYPTDADDEFFELFDATIPAELNVTWFESAAVTSLQLPAESDNV